MPDQSAETLFFLYVAISIFPSWESVLENPSQHFAETQPSHGIIQGEAWHRPDSLWFSCELAALQNDTCDFNNLPYLLEGVSAKWSCYQGYPTPLVNSKPKTSALAHSIVGHLHLCHLCFNHSIKLGIIN